MDTKAKEKLGIAYLEIPLLKTEIVDTEFTKNDKTISWDGFLKIHKSEPFSKINLEGSIPVQIKTKSVKNFNKKNPISVDDVNNFIQEKRVMYFVVQLKGNEYKIYYKSMLLWDLKKFIKNCGGHKSQGVEFSELPISNSTQIKSILLKFLSESKKQVAVLGDNILSLEDYMKHIRQGKLTFDVDIPLDCSIQELFNQIKNQQPYLYYEDPKSHIKFPVDKFTGDGVLISLGAKIENPIIVDGEILYDEIMKFNTGDSIHYKISNQINIVFKDEKYVINFSVNGTLKERINVLKFMLGLNKDHSFVIDGRSLVVENLLSKDKEKVFVKLLKFYLEVDRLFNKIGVEKELDFKNMKEKDFVLLQSLINGELYSKPVLNYALEGDSNFICDIANVKILVYVKNIDETHKLFINMFSQKECQLLALSEPEPIPVSNYLILIEKELWGNFDNINYLEMMESITKNYDVNKHEYYYTQLILNMISHYDKTKDTDLLDAVKCLSLFMYEKNSTDINFINLCQVKVRADILNDDDIKRLIKIKEETDDLYFKCACCCILNSKKEFKLFFNELKDEKKEEFKLYPIYNLIK